MELTVEEIVENLNALEKGGHLCSVWINTKAIVEFQNQTKISVEEEAV